MTSYFRIQEHYRHAADLLDPENWQSSYWGRNEDEGDNTRYGISTCESVEDLATYWRSHGGDLSMGVVLIELTGTLAEQRDHDHADGARLIYPDSIVAVTELPEEFWDVLMADDDAA